MNKNKNIQMFIMNKQYLTNKELYSLDEHVFFFFFFLCRETKNISFTIIHYLGNPNLVASADLQIDTQTYNLRQSLKFN